MEVKKIEKGVDQRTKERQKKQEGGEEIQKKKKGPTNWSKENVQ